MCGIVGGTHLDRERLETALERIRHRGPDAWGIWTAPDHGVACGQTRLSILDLATRANQPMVCPRTGNVLVFNGEIYNFRALRSELEGRGWRFRTTSDTEVLLAAYGEWGGDCLARLNGMFAFAVYDPARGSVFLARDRVGKKPLYYTRYRGELAWASEIKALLALRPDVPKDLNPAALRAYLDLGYIPGEESIYRHVHKLLPAHYATYSLASRMFSAWRYWELPPPREGPIAEDAAAEELEALLQDAIRIRLESDVPIGAFLSGGLDSSLIVAMTARQAGNLVAYTARFPVARYDESPVAAQLAERLGIEHRVLPVEAADTDALQRMGRQFDEPFADSSLLPTYLVSRAIREHVKVALSGDGGDELFAGYDYYALVQAERRWELLPRGLRRLLSPAHHALPAGIPGKNLLRRLPYDGADRFLRVSAEPETARILPVPAATDADLRRLPRDAYRRGLLAEMERRYAGNPGLTTLQKMTRLDFGSYLPDDILVKVDRASMSTGLEVRSPLLDYRIVEFAYSLPDDLRLRGDVRKYLLKRVARRYLPADFPFEGKRGFSIPEAEWFRGEWATLLRDRVREGTTLLDPGRVARIQALHQAGGRQNRMLFKALMLAQFERHYGVA